MARMTYAFPTAIILLSLGAAVVYAFAGDVRKSIYFFAAAVITASVAY